MIYNKRSITKADRLKPVLLGRERISGANFLGHGDGWTERFRANARVRAATCERRENCFRRYISHQIVARKGTSAQSGERSIETPATGIVGGENFFRGA